MTYEKTYEKEALEYIAKLADGGCRDSITYLDKCLAYSHDLTIENVVAALGIVEYEDMMRLTTAVLDEGADDVIQVIEKLHSDGKDLKQFVRLYLNFLLDVSKWMLGVDEKYIGLPKTDSITNWLVDKDFMGNVDYDTELLPLLNTVVKLNAEIKYSQYVKADIEAALLVFQREVTV